MTEDYEAYQGICPKVSISGGQDYLSLSPNEINLDQSPMEQFTGLNIIAKSNSQTDRQENNHALEHSIDQSILGFRIPSSYGSGRIISASELKCQLFKVAQRYLEESRKEIDIQSTPKQSKISVKSNLQWGSAFRIAQIAINQLESIQRQSMSQQSKDSLFRELQLKCRQAQVKVSDCEQKMKNLLKQLEKKQKQMINFQITLREVNRKLKQTNQQKIKALNLAEDLQIELKREKDRTQQFQGQLMKMGGMKEREEKLQILYREATRLVREKQMRLKHLEKPSNRQAAIFQVQDYEGKVSSFLKE